MPRIVLLDTGILGMLTYPRRNPQIRPWLAKIRQTGVNVRVPEIADYEIRRELLRKKWAEAIRRLDMLKLRLGYLPITTEAMLQAAEFWAEARTRGLAATGDQALDGDVILAAQAAVLAREGTDVVIATSNVKHLELFAAARRWDEMGE
jgi:predicted nucleic acid-binding protein